MAPPQKNDLTTPKNGVEQPKKAKKRLFEPFWDVGKDVLVPEKKKRRDVETTENTLWADLWQNITFITYHFRGVFPKRGSKSLVDLYLMITFRPSLMQMPFRVPSIGRPERS